MKKIKDIVNKKSKIKYFVDNVENPTIAHTGYEGYISYREIKFIQSKNFAFEMIFDISNISRGRSSTVLNIIDIETNYRYELTPSQIQELFKLIQNGKVEICNVNGKTYFKGIFCLGKQGMSYTLIPLGEVDDKES